MPVCRQHGNACITGGKLDRRRKQSSVKKKAQKLCPAFYQEIERSRPLVNYNLQGLYDNAPLINKPDENRKIFTKLHHYLKILEK